MNCEQYIEKVLNALVQKQHLLNISALEREAKMPVNSVRKWLRKERYFSAVEASRIASVLHDIGFVVSALNITAQQASRLPWK